MTVPDRDAVLRFREGIRQVLGLVCDDARLGELGALLQRRLQARALAVHGYLGSLLAGGDFARGECDALAAELTVGETYFFRHHEQFDAFSEVALPDCLRRDPRGLSILSLGCASGEEAYSLAILVRELAPHAAERVAITAVDVNPIALAKAEAGRYGPWSLRETSPERQRRWFHADGREAVVDPSIRAMVRFECGNLADPQAACWRREAYDIVFARNVLMYLAPEITRVIVSRILSSIRQPGYLFLGSAETLRGLSHRFHLRHTHGAFYYQARIGDAGPDDAHDPGAMAALPRRDLRRLSDAVDGAGSWVDTISHSSRRISDLVAQAEAPRAQRTLTTRPDLSSVVDSLRAERYAEALELLLRLPQSSADDADALLLKAIALTHGGDTVEAERVARSLLARDDLNAGAHYVLALCREAAGDSHGAAEHDRMSAYLDPGFAMPRLHLGLLARRRGDRNEAVADLRDALILLRREEPSRLLLFGGGFDRDALAAICQAELDASTEHP